MITQRIPIPTLNITGGVLTIRINLDCGTLESSLESLIENNGITYSEARVLKLMNLPAKLIAHQLHVAESTVKKHIGSLLDKTGCKSSKELALWAHRNNIIKQ